MLDEPACRAITGSSQRAQVVLSELDSYATELARDRNMRRRLWRNRGLAPTGQGSGCQRRYKAFAELMPELARRLEGRIAVVREVEVQPKLGVHSVDQPDILAIAVDRHRSDPAVPGGHGRLQAGVVTALRTQLADRYLSGPVGAEGVYVAGISISKAGTKPTRTAGGLPQSTRPPDELQRLLANEATTVARTGKIVHVRVIEIPVDGCTRDVSTSMTYRGLPGAWYVWSGTGKGARYI